MRLKLIGYRDRKQGYHEPGYYIRVPLSTITPEDRHAIKIWCTLKEGTIIDHSTIFFKEKSDAQDFMEMFS